MRKLASSSRGAVVLPFAALALLVGCGGDPKPAPQPPVATDAPAVQPPPAAPSGSAVAETPTPAASGSAKADAPPPRQSSGLPAVIKEDPKEITDSFGSRPGKIVIGDKEFGTFKIPENALGQGTNITFKLDPKGKANGAPIGKIYRLISVIPPADAPTPVTTNGPPFELSLPAGNKKDANLAIGKTETDDKGHEKLKWTVIAPKRIDDATGIAYFELTELSDYFLHITTKPPTEKK